MASVGNETQASKSTPMPSGGSIQLQSGFYEGLEVLLDRDWLVIGRGRGADVVLAEATISRAHAAIGFDAGRFFVQDLGRIALFFLKGFILIFSLPLQINKILQQVYFIGMKSVFVVCLTGAFTGMVLVMSAL